MRKIFTFLLLIHISTAYSASYNGNIMPFKQPDGTFVDVKLYGTEYYMRGEGLDNYTLIRDRQTNWLCYAKLSSDGNELQSTGIVYNGKKGFPQTLRNDLNLPFHLDINTVARKKIIKEKQLLLNESPSLKIDSKGSGANVMDGTTVRHVTGNILGLCIVIDFPDEPGTVPISEYDDLCNDLNYNGYGNNGSLRTYFSDVSGGLLNYQNVVYGVFRAPHTFTYYDSLPFTIGAKQVLNLALHWIDSLGFDFSTLSLNPDSSIMAINIMYTGFPPVWSEGMWFHAGSYNGFSADGVHTGRYNTSPANAPLGIGTVCHENGHMVCGWPDTYKYDNTTGPDGIGSFDLMCAYGDQHNPVPPNPLFRSNAGWGQVVDVTNYNGLNYDTAGSMTCFRYNNLNDTNEFFLLENRIRTGRSLWIDDEGLTIWHINRKGNNQSLNHEVFLEHADNILFNQNNACFHAPSFTEFSHSTSPSSNWITGDPSGLRVWEIASVDSILTYKLGSGVPGPSLNLQYISLSNDNNANGFIEAGESADVNINSLNTGQFNSSLNTIVTCTATGVNASYITVNTSPINLGVINALQSIPGLFNITIDPLTPLGTQFYLQFILADSSDTSIVTQRFVIGEQVIMDNSNSVVCNAVFYDSGFLSDYNNDEDLIKTIFPAVSGNMISVKFNLFDLENEPTCIYDYLQIYDGPNPGSPLIGRFCTINPDSIVSTHPSGALTFQFHSDEGLIAQGWEAFIYCIPFLDVNEISAFPFSVSPNPTNGIVQLNGNSIEGYSLYDIYGRIILKSDLPVGNDEKIDLSDEPAGVYLIKVKSVGVNYCRKIIVR